MKTLILLRHAKSSWEYAVADRNRPLKEKGIRRIQAMASVSREVFGSIPHFYSSPGNRALHTAIILLHELNLHLEQLHAGLEVTDKIAVQIAQHAGLEKAVGNNKSYIMSETLTEALDFVAQLPNGQALTFDEIDTQITIKKL